MLKNVHPSIIVATVVLVPAVAYTLFIANLFTGVIHTLSSEQVQATIQPSVVAPNEQPAAPLSTSTPTPVAVTPEIAPTTTDKATTPSPSVYQGKYSAEMTEIGIADSDKALVASLMIDGDKWMQLNRSPKSRELHTIQDPTQRIGYANFYVKERWGSWQGAVAFAAANEGNW